MIVCLLRTPASDMDSNYFLAVPLLIHFLANVPGKVEDLKAYILMGDLTEAPGSRFQAGPALTAVPI